MQKSKTNTRLRYTRAEEIVVLVILFLLAIPVSGDITSIECPNILSLMTPQERVGQVFMPAISPSGSNGTTQMTDELENMFDSIHPGGVFLFARDISTIDQAGHSNRCPPECRCN
jgi:hypothetical protein